MVTAIQLLHTVYLFVLVDAFRAYPGSEIVVANTLAKWNKLKPSEINFNQGFCQKVVSKSCLVFNSLPARDDFCLLLITFANSLDPIRPDILSGLIWV